MIDSSPPWSSRQVTLRTVVAILLDRGPMSRAQLSRETGLSKQTMSEVFRELEDDGWLQLAGKSKGSIGRSAVTYAARHDRSLVFGADVGGTKIHAAIADMGGKILSEGSELTDVRGAEHVIAQVAGLSTSLAHKAGLPIERIQVGTVGIPGAFDHRSKRVFMVPNIVGFEGLALVDDLQARVGFHVLVGNDVNMAAKGEQTHGAGQDADSFVFIALGTGIGMGIISDRRILVGARGAAGEISTLPLGSDPFDGRARRAGALETAIGSVAIRARYEGAGGTPGLAMAQIFDGIATGDCIAASTLDEVARTLAQAIMAVAAVLDPQKVVLGGSIGARSELLQRVIHFLSICMPNPPTCAISTLGSKAGLYGTLAHSTEWLRDRLFQPQTGKTLRPAIEIREPAR